jgi:hypothetical protein
MSFAISLLTTNGFEDRAGGLLRLGFKSRPPGPASCRVSPG